MGFSINPDFKSIKNYDQALARWESIGPWKFATVSDPRPLDRNRRKKHVTILRQPDGSIALSLFRTDVIVYHPDGDVTVTPHASISTDMFGRYVLPDGMTPWFNGTPCPMIGLRERTPRMSFEERMYRIVKATRFTQVDYAIWRHHESTPAPVIQIPTLDRVRAREALAHCKYKDFRAWFLGYCALVPMTEVGGFRGLTADEQLEILAAGPSRWLEFTKLRWTRWRFSAPLTDNRFAILEELRQIIYRKYQCITSTAVTSLNYSGVRHYSRASRKYRYLV